MGVRSQAQNLVVESLTPLFCLMDLLYHFCLIFSIFPSSSSELNSKTSVYAKSKQNFLDLGTKLRAGFSYPIYLSAAAIQEITNGEYTITAKGIVYVDSRSQMDIMVMIGSGDVILTGRVYLDQKPLLYKINTEKIV